MYVLSISSYTYFFIRLLVQIKYSRCHLICKSFFNQKKNPKLIKKLYKNNSTIKYQYQLPYDLRCIQRSASQYKIFPRAKNKRKHSNFAQPEHKHNKRANVEKRNDKKTTPKRPPYIRGRSRVPQRSCSLSRIRDDTVVASFRDAHLHKIRIIIKSSDISGLGCTAAMHPRAAHLDLGW